MKQSNKKNKPETDDFKPLKQSQKPRKSQLGLGGLIWIALFAVLVYFFFQSMTTEPRTEIPYSVFKEQVREGNITEVKIKGQKITGEFRNEYKPSPSIIFIDELDSIGRSRGTGVGGGHDEREQTLNQILNEMDGFAPQQSVIVLAATNRPDVLDPALTRPGRFDRQITLDMPQKEARKKILEIHTCEVPLHSDVDLDNLAARTVGFSGADLKNLVNEAALLAARENKDKVASENFIQARDKIILGHKREDMISDEEKRIRIMLGGRSAEKLIFDDISNGAASDLKNATKLARKMVTQWGMSERLGPVTFSRGEEHIFLGREMARPQDFSEDTARIIDEEIKKIISHEEENALEELQKNRQLLKKLAKTLFEKETLEREEVEAILGEDSNEDDNKSKEGRERGHSK